MGKKKKRSEQGYPADLPPDRLPPMSIDERTIRTMIGSCDRIIQQVQEERAMLVALLPDDQTTAKESMARVTATINKILGRSK